jgi:hypothetical protein
MDSLVEMNHKLDELPSLILFSIFESVRTEGLLRGIRLFLLLMSHRYLSHRLKLCGIYV